MFGFYKFRLDRLATYYCDLSYTDRTSTNPPAPPVGTVETTAIGLLGIIISSSSNSSEPPRKFALILELIGESPSNSILF